MSARKPKKEELKAFVRKVAMRDNLSGDYDINEAVEDLRSLVNEARYLLGIQLCDDCGDEVDELVGCPDGAEICQDCFDGGSH